MRTIIVFLFLAMALGVFLSAEAFAQFYVIPVGTGRGSIPQDDVVELKVANTGYDPRLIPRIMPDGSLYSGNGYRVPDGRRLVLTSATFTCYTSSSTSYIYQLIQYINIDGSDISTPRGTWRFVCNKSMQVNFFPGIIIDEWYIPKVCIADNEETLPEYDTSTADSGGIEGTFYGYLIDK